MEPAQPILILVPTGAALRRAVVGLLLCTFSSAGLAAYELHLYGAGTASPAALIAAVIALVGGLWLVHEFIHYLLFGMCGASPKLAPNRTAIHAPDARLTSAQYLAVLLAPVLTITGTGIALLCEPRLLLPGLMLTAGVPAVAASDLYRARVVLRHRDGSTWADRPGHVVRYPPKG